MTSRLDQNTTLHRILDAEDIGVLIWDKERVLVYANNAAERLLPLRPAIGKRLPDTVSIGRVIDSENKNASSDTWPVSRAFAGENVDGELVRYIETNGAHRWLCTTARRILDTDGNLEYVLSTMTDATENKARDSRLRFMLDSAKVLSVTTDFRKRLLEKAKLAVPSLADWCAIDILGDDGTIERVAVIHQDPKQVEYLYEFERRFPTDPERPGGAAQVIASGSAVFVPRITDDMLVGGAISEEHLRALRDLNLSSVMVIPIPAGGRVLGAMSLAYAESGRTYTENDLEFFKEFCFHMGVVLDNAHLFDEVQRRDEAKDRFLASLSHELRNPLAPIRSSLELLRLKELNPEAREEIDIIDHQFSHMAKLLDDLLDVSRFTQDKIELSTHPVELRPLVERSLRASDSLLREADITLHFTYPSMPLTVRGDDTRLEQAISNLMSNASKFTPAGGSIWVDLARESDEAVIRVRDSGVGIHAEDLPNIFRMYYQGAHKKKNFKSGLGIGLVLVQRIVDMHGGTVVAKSAGVGLGSEFIIRLPLSVDAFTETSAPNSSGRSLNGLGILVVDDNIAAADSLVKLLRKLGARAEAAYSGSDTLARNDLSSYGLFLLDIGMPHMDGYMLIQALRDRGVASPVVALTGYGLIEDKERASAAGFDAHLTKPVGIRELTSVFLSVGVE